MIDFQDILLEYGDEFISKHRLPPHIKKVMNNIKVCRTSLQMVRICGLRIDPNSVTVTDGIEVKGYVPRLYEYFAACDLAVVQDGGTTTMELVSLNKKDQIIINL